MAWEMVHEIEHKVFENHAQTAGAELAVEGVAGHRPQCAFRKAQFHILEFKQPLVLPGQRVLRTGEYFEQSVLVEVVQHAHHWQPSHELRDQSVLDKIYRLNLTQYFDVSSVGTGARRSVGVEPHTAAAHPPLDNALQADEGPATNEQNVGGVNRRELLVGVLATALRWHVGDRALEDLQEGLLHTFARDVTGDRRILVFLRDFIDLVNIDDSLLSPLHVVVGILQELQDDVFHVLADVARLGEGGGVHDGKGNVQHPRQRLRHQRLPGACRPDQQNVGLRQLNIAALPAEPDAFVVVVNCYGQLFLGSFLPYHVLLQESLHLDGAGKSSLQGRRTLRGAILQNAVADRNALVANVGSRMLVRGR